MSDALGVGAIVMSCLPLNVFQAQQPHGQVWVACDGLDHPGTAYERLVDNSRVPDLSDRYPRCTGGIAGAPGSAYDDQVGPHNHTYTAQGENAEGGTGFWGHGWDSNSGASSAVFKVDRSGDGIGAETRPKTFVVNFYLRVT